MLEASNSKVMILCQAVLGSKVDVELGVFKGCGQFVQLDLLVHQHSLHIVQVDSKARYGGKETLPRCVLYQVNLGENGNKFKNLARDGPTVLLCGKLVNQI